MLILMAGVFVITIGFAAIAVDVGYFLRAKRALQNAADAMVLAGAQQTQPCGGSDALALAAAMDWADLNYATDFVPPDMPEVQTVLIPGDAVYTKLEREVPLFLMHIFGLPKVTVSAVAQATCSFASEGEGLRPWGVQEEPAGDQAANPCFDQDGVPGEHADGSAHHEPLWAQLCNLTFRGGEGQQGEFGMLQVKAYARTGCMDPSPQGGAEAYRDAIYCGSYETFCLYDGPGGCLDDTAYSQSFSGDMGGPTRQGIGELLETEGACDRDGDGRDDWDGNIEWRGPVPYYTCNSPRVIPIFVIRNFDDPDDPPNGFYIHHFAAVYIVGCASKDKPVDPDCKTGGGGQLQVRVRFVRILDSANFAGGQATGFINVVTLTK